MLPPWRSMRLSRGNYKVGSGPISGGGLSKGTTPVAPNSTNVSGLYRATGNELEPRVIVVPGYRAPRKRYRPTEPSWFSRLRSCLGHVTELDPVETSMCPQESPPIALAIKFLHTEIPRHPVQGTGESHSNQASQSEALDVGAREVCKQTTTTRPTSPITPPRVWWTCW